MGNNNSDYDLDAPEYLNWDEPDEQAKEQSQKAADAQRRRAVAFHDVFAKSEAGQKILTEWVQKYCTGAPVSVNATDRAVHMNDGKRELIADILQQIQIGEML